ncbi:Uu.00g063220.m01.CDS01 [Anthostomella pinea]|uniref:Uu.00g063220.m01.CDS01 n=1 Tax=Anthostomella pinea TaxID=933095 RepID=A0AAI8YKK1_9PEZI|nr:Uu.00g063220.m01.CDS01 [Anthostomella pinea]
MATSRPTSLAIPRTASPFLNPPSLADILSDSAPQPWTLGAFMAFLSQNHCLETLEFILDAERYRAAHLQTSQGQLYLGSHHISELWQKIIEAYIMPCAPREVNLPARVRDRLLGLTFSLSNPVDPSELDEAVHIVRELMNDSVLVPFLESMMPAAVQVHADDEPREARQGRSRLRLSREAVTKREPSQSPRTSLLPLFGRGRNSLAALNRSNSGSIDSPDLDLTDDSNSPGSTPGSEPVTPPTTPPTSDYSFGTSPNTLQRAISGNGWKKVGAKLGLGRKSRSSRRTNQPGAPSSNPTITTTTELGISNPALTTHEADDTTRSSWEDPHPGDRFSISFGKSGGSNTDSQISSGDAMGGVAAKALSAYDGDGPWIRRRVRIRHRHTMPKPLKIPAQVPEELEAKSAPLISSRCCDVTTSPSPLLFLPLIEPLGPLEIDTDSETEVGIEVGTVVDDMEVDNIKLASVSHSCLTDFSNYLSMTRLDDDNDGTSVSVVDSDAFTRTGSADDLYGWEAELNRQIDCGMDNAGTTCDCHHYQYQSSDFTKRGILHRVFSPSGRRVNTTP